MNDSTSPSNEPKPSSAGPLRIHRDGENIFVTGFGLRLRVESDEEAKKVIAELEDQGYKICY
jgi:hypothetical protein